jgi:hypothetical protein
MPDEPTHPSPPSNATIRTTGAAHRELLRRYGLRGPHDHMPAGVHFLEHEVVRIPVTQTPAARAFLVTTSAQGRLFPHALAEVFGAIPSIASIALDAPTRATLDAIQGDQGIIVSVTITPTVGSTHTFHLNGANLCQIHPRTRIPAFNALATSTELARLYHLATGA